MRAHSSPSRKLGHVMAVVVLLVSLGVPGTQGQATIVVVSPKVSPETRSISLLGGAEISVTMDCDNISRAVTWYKGELPLSDYCTSSRRDGHCLTARRDFDGQRLVIRNFSKQDEGSYSCQGEGKKSLPIVLTASNRSGSGPAQGTSNLPTAVSTAAADTQRTDAPESNTSPTSSSSTSTPSYPSLDTRAPSTERDLFATGSSKKPNSPASDDKLTILVVVVVVLGSATMTAIVLAILCRMYVVKRRGEERNPVQRDPEFGERIEMKLDHLNDMGQEQLDMLGERIEASNGAPSSRLFTEQTEMTRPSHDQSAAACQEAEQRYPREEENSRLFQDSASQTTLV